jgi:hypothetical protein
VIEGYENDMDSSLKGILKAIINPLFRKKLEYRDWTITDIDNHLLGNPHI